MNNGIPSNQINKATVITITLGVLVLSAVLGVIKMKYLNVNKSQGEQMLESFPQEMMRGALPTSRPIASPRVCTWCKYNASNEGKCQMIYWNSVTRVECPKTPNPKGIQCIIDRGVCKNAQ